MKLSTPGLMDEIPIASIVKSSLQLRDDLGDLQGLIKSISEVGLLQPIIVRPRNGVFEVVAGNRRLQACTMLGWRKIACHVVDIDDRRAYEISLIENLQHQTMTPFEEAKAFRQYVKQFGWGGTAELSRRIGKSETYVSRRIRLLSLPEDVQELVLKQCIPITSAHELTSIPEPEMQRKLAYEITEKKLTRRLVRMRVKEVTGEATTWQEQEPWGLSHPDRPTLEQRAIQKAIVALRIALWRLGSIILTIEDASGDTELKDKLFAYRRHIHRFIGELQALKKKWKVMTERKP